MATKGKKKRVLSMIQRNPNIRGSILRCIERDGCSYSQIIEELNAKQIPVDASQLSRYLNNNVQLGAILTERAILAICKKFDIKVKLEIEEPQYA